MSWLGGHANENPAHVHSGRRQKHVRQKDEDPSPLFCRPSFCQLLLNVLLLTPLAALYAAESWWHKYTPVATVGLRAESLETIQPGAARGVGTLDWYGFWFLEAQEQAGYLEAGTSKLRQAGVKRIVYYDLGEVGDYAAFFTADGKMTHNGWSLPWWDGREPLTAVIVTNGDPCPALNAGSAVSRLTRYNTYAYQAGR